MLLFSSPYGRLGASSGQRDTVPKWRMQARQIRPTRIIVIVNLFVLLVQLRLRPVLTLQRLSFFHTERGGAHWMSKSHFVVAAEPKATRPRIVLDDVAPACRFQQFRRGKLERRQSGTILAALPSAPQQQQNGSSNPVGMAAAPYENDRRCSVKTGRSRSCAGETKKVAFVSHSGGSDCWRLRGRWNRRRAVRWKPEPSIRTRK